MENKFHLLNKMFKQNILLRAVWLDGSNMLLGMCTSSYFLINWLQVAVHHSIKLDQSPESHQGVSGDVSRARGSSQQPSDR